MNKKPILSTISLAIIITFLWSQSIWAMGALPVRPLIHLISNSVINVQQSAGVSFISNLTESLTGYSGLFQSLNLLDTFTADSKGNAYLNDTFPVTYIRKE